MIGRGVKDLLEKLFDIRPGEISRTLLMQLTIFLIITSLLIIKPTVNGLFVSRFGAEGLPYAYILVAFLAVAVSTIYSRLMSRSSLRNMIIGTFVLNVIVLAGFGLLLNQAELPSWELYLIYIWVSIFGVFSASQFWILANVLFNVREAKRLFGFIGAGAIIGGILGGYATKLLAPRIGSENLLFVGAGLLFLCIPITLFIWKRYIKDLTQQSTERKQLTRYVANPLKLIRGSRHLTYLAIIIGVSVIVAKLVDFQYSDIASRKITEQDELTAFFGLWFSNFSILSLLLQLFLTRRLLSQLGIGGALMFLPGGIFLGALALLFFPELWAAVLIKGADAGLKQSVNKAAIELLGLPIPLEVKKRTKTFIDVVVDSIATGIGGLILIFLVRGLNLSTQAITLMIIFLLLIWAYFSYRIQDEYLLSFRKNILKIKKGKKTPVINKKTLFENLEKILKEGKEQEIHWVLQQLQGIDEERFFQPCVRLLDHASAEIRAGALRVLEVYSDKQLNDKVWPLTEDPNPEVQVAAYNYLVTHDSSQLQHIRDTLLQEDINYRVRGPVLVTMAAETNRNPVLREFLGVEGFIKDRLEMVRMIEDPEEKRFRSKILATGIGEANIPETFHILEDSLRNTADPEVVEQAILAAGKTSDPRFIPILIAFLAKKKTRMAAIHALVDYGPGVLAHLSDIVYDPAVDVEAIRHATEVAERLETPEAVEFLFQLSEHEDQGVQIEALRSLTDLKRNFPHIKFDSKVILERILREARLYQETLSTLYAQQAKGAEPGPGNQESEKIVEARQGLIRLLEHRLENHFERIFRLLGLRYSPNDFSLFLAGNVRNSKREFQANTIEFLENLLHPTLKRVVIPIVESAMTETLTQKVLDSLNVDVPQERECFQMLLDNNDLRLKLSVFYLIEQLNNSEYLSLAEPYLTHNNPKVRDYATRVYSHLKERQ